MEKKVDTSDQNVQTAAQTEDKKPTTALVSRLVQTEEEKKAQREVRNLSPFETYDLLFIRDLVNNLNYDNEVLNDNSADLKTAFMFPGMRTSQSAMPAPPRGILHLAYGH